MVFARVLSGVLCLIIFWCTAACALGVGDMAPAFQAVTLTGQTVSLDDVKNARAMVLVFWATWCPFCEAAIPEFKEVYSKYGPKGVIFLAINPGVNDSLRKTQLYVEKFGIPYPVIYEGRGTIARNYGVNGVPTVVMVDNTGTVRYNDAAMSADFLKRLDDAVNSPEQAHQAARR